MDVPKLVQEQLRMERNARGEEDGSPQRDRGDGSLADEHARDAHRQAAAPPMDRRQLRELGDDLGRQLERASDQGGKADVVTSHRSPEASTTSLRPSVRSTMLPMRSVRRICAPAFASERSVSVSGCPYRFAAPTEMTATRGRTAAKNSAVVLVELPWCATFNTSARRLSRACSSSHASSPRSASPVSRNRTAPTRARTTVLASLGSSRLAVHAESGARNVRVTSSTRSESPGLTRRQRTPGLAAARALRY